jgi:hypothetical protein
MRKPKRRVFPLHEKTKVLIGPCTLFHARAGEINVKN